MGRKKENFSEILEQELGYRQLSREKFYRILKKKKLSSQEFLKLLDIIEKQ